MDIPPLPVGRGPAPGWHLVLPVKGGDTAKSRLRPPAGVARPALARAMALDTVAAALACPVVDEAVVVTGDVETVRGLAALLDAWAGPRARLVVAGDPGLGLGAAIRSGLARVGGGPVGVLLADLPAVRGADLDAALSAAAEHASAYVADADGTGTVLLTGDDVGSLHPAFGEGSAARHATTATRLDLDLPRLRRDVDDAAALAEAIGLGVGSHTRAVVPAALAGELAG